MARLASVALLRLGAASASAWRCEPWSDLVAVPLGVSASLGSGPVFVATQRGLFACDEAHGTCATTSVGACQDVAADAQGRVHLVMRSASEAQRAQSCDLQGNCLVIGRGSERWEYPVAVAANAEGTAVVADAYHGLKMCNNGACRNLTLPGHGSQRLNVAFGDDGDVFVTDRDGARGVARCGSADVCEDLVDLDAFGYKGVQPYAIGVSHGALFIGGRDTSGAFSVRRCLLSGQCEVLASELDEIHGLSVSAAGVLYIGAGASLVRCMAAVDADGVLV